jgi:recombinational DNA repair ATPase RecF
LRILWLHIPRDRNLRNFEIKFDETQPTTVFLGRNGLGKSNLIEAIVRIFRDLELGSHPSFAYQIRYVCREKTIEIDADPERATKRIEIKVDGATLSQTAFQRE